MKLSFILKALIVLFAIGSSHGVVFTRCILAKKLLELGFPKNMLREWVCLIEAESERNTRFKRGPSKGGTYKWGLFQIDGKYACDQDGTGGFCNIHCNDLLTDLSAGARCALFLYKYLGFYPWEQWYFQCRDHTLSNLDICGIKY